LPGRETKLSGKDAVGFFIRLVSHHANNLIAGEFEEFPNAGPLVGDEFKEQYMSLQWLMWVRIMQEEVQDSEDPAQLDKSIFDRSARDCHETAQGTYFEHSPAHQQYKSEQHLWGMYCE
jgi:hypothetical protein